MATRSISLTPASFESFYETGTFLFQQEAGSQQAANPNDVAPHQFRFVRLGLTETEIQINAWGSRLILGSLVGLARLIYGIGKTILSLMAALVCWDAQPLHIHARNGLYHIGRGVIEIIPCFTGLPCLIYDLGINYRQEPLITNATFIQVISYLPITGSLVGVVRLTYGIGCSLIFGIASVFSSPYRRRAIEGLLNAGRGLIEILPFSGIGLAIYDIYVLRRIWRISTRVMHGDDFYMSVVQEANDHRFEQAKMRMGSGSEFLNKAFENFKIKSKGSAGDINKIQEEISLSMGILHLGSIAILECLINKNASQEVEFFKKNGLQNQMDGLRDEWEPMFADSRIFTDLVYKHLLHDWIKEIDKDPSRDEGLSDIEEKARAFYEKIKGLSYTYLQRNNADFNVCMQALSVTMPENC